MRVGAISWLKENDITDTLDSLEIFLEKLARHDRQGKPAKTRICVQTENNFRSESQNRAVITA